MNECGSVPIKPDYKKQVASYIWPVGSTLATPGTEEKHPALELGSTHFKVWLPDPLSQVSHSEALNVFPYL